MPSTNINEIMQIVGDQLGVSDLNPNDRIVEDLGAESADLANIVAAVEDRFNITVQVEKLGDLRTIQDIFVAVQNA